MTVVVGIGGTTRANSFTEKALRAVLAVAERAGAETSLLGADALDLPMDAPEDPARSDRALRLIAELRRADGVVIASPGYDRTRAWRRTPASQRVCNRSQRQLEP